MATPLIGPIPAHCIGIGYATQERSHEGRQPPQMGELTSRYNTTAAFRNFCEKGSDYPDGKQRTVCRPRMITLRN